MSDPSRPPQTIMRECASTLALMATRSLYEEQPVLWDLGESGRARTLEDFGHHFLALAALDGDAFSRHVEYCTRLFEARGFPLRWLEDAWRVMAAVCREQLAIEVAFEALSILDRYTAEAP